MNILIITQKVDKNDAVLGFFHRWIEEFAIQFKTVTVICLEKGTFSLPENVRVYSLGKEEGVSRIEYIRRFYRYIYSLRNEYDVVFVHMNPEYIVLGGLLWKIWKKKVGLWYVHRQTNLKLSIAAAFADMIFTSSKESFGIQHPHTYYLGHGIDLKVFSNDSQREGSEIISVGRITKIKNLNTFVSLTDRIKEYNLTVIGGPVTKEDTQYAEELKDMNSSVQWIPSMSQAQLAHTYAKAFASVNLSPTGGMDKTVLESWASGCPAFVSNEAFRNLLGQHAETFMFNLNDSEDLAQKIKAFSERPDREIIVQEIAQKVRKEFGIEELVQKITSLYA